MMPPASDERSDEPVHHVDPSKELEQQQRQQHEKPGRLQAQQPTQAPPSSQSTKRSATAPLSSATTSLTSSPKTSRDTSPVRPTPLKLGQNAPRLSRSRKNSQDLSPHRTPNSGGPPLPDTPSAAAIQRALSATPRLASPANGEQAADPQKPQRATRSPAGGSQNSANTSSRVKSPPNPTTPGRVGSFASRKNEHEPSTPATPRIVVEDGAGKPTSKNFEAIAEEEDETPSGMRSPAKAKSSSGVLEVVQESSLPETPAISSTAPPQNTKSRSSRSSVNESEAKDSTTKPTAIINESGSESGGNKSSTSLRKDPMKSQKMQSATKPAPLKSTNSFTQLASSKNKATGDGPVRNMTVETETVTSAPNAGITGTGQREASGRVEGGTLRLKPSTETIRPKKDKKKAVRKAPSVHAGTSSSKADIFEAKVASAVDEADSSDSEETFVYESNPPEPHTRPHRYHSRTPSAASTASQADHYGGRYRPDGHNSIVGKKSMKFANNPHHFNGYPGDGDNASQAGTIGSGRGSSVNGNQYHHHIGRHGRAPGHTSIFDSDSPFPNATSKPVQHTKHARIVSRPNSPRSPFTPRAPGSAKSHRSIYNLEDDVADDERTPLVNNARNSRTRNSRRPDSRYDPYGQLRPRGVFGGLICWLLLGLLVTLLVVAIIVALVLCSKPLTNVRLRDIKNVIASEEEIVFDLHVHAINPNIVAIQVDRVDMKIFAKSKHVGSSKLQNGSHPQRRKEMASLEAALTHSATNTSTTYHGSGGIDEGTDPIEEPGGTDTMLLGRVSHLDSPLTFDASPLRHHIVSDSGEVSLPYPGNTTADEGSDRWKTVVQHTFELIVVGQLRYTLPISSKPHTVSFGQAKTSVDPDSPVSDKGLSLPFSDTVNKRRLRLTFTS